MSNDNISTEIKLMGKRDIEEYTENEKLLADIWGRVLGYEEINVYDDFYSMGINSIIAMQLYEEMVKNGITIETDNLYIYPSINELSTYLDENQSGNE
jgi:aryl carrier-like protein